MDFERQAFLVTGVALMMVCSLLGALLPRLTLKQARSLHLIAVLIGGFVVIGFLYPWGRELLWDDERVFWGRVVAVGIFFGLLAMFRLMGRFESPG
jgi:hypothetical protein